MHLLTRFYGTILSGLTIIPLKILHSLWVMKIAGNGVVVAVQTEILASKNLLVDTLNQIVDCDTSVSLDSILYCLSTHQSLFLILDSEGSDQ